MAERICAHCGLPIPNGSGYGTYEFGSKELHFHSDRLPSGKTCLDLYREKHKEQSIAYNGGGASGKVKDFLGVTGFKQEASQSALGRLAVGATGAAAGAIGNAIKEYNSPENKARRAAEAEQRRQEAEQRRQEAIRKEIERRVNIISDYDPKSKIEEKKGLSKKIEISDEISTANEIFGWYEQVVNEHYYNEDYTMFFKVYGNQIETLIPEVISLYKEYKPKIHPKYERKYQILKCLKNIMAEAKEIGGENARKLNENLDEQKALIENKKNAFNELYLQIPNRIKERFVMTIKAYTPFVKVTKSDLANFKENAKQHKIEMKNALADATKNKKENLGRLKAEAAKMQKEGNKELAVINKKIARFRRYRPTKEEFEAELKKI